MNKAKPFQIPKSAIWQAYKQVKANRGSAGIDGQSIEEFESNLRDNLYKLWNRMSSGSYFPPPVKRVDIPKGQGESRPLGIPTVTDRVAQTVVKNYLEPKLESYFHSDSYGYRPAKSAIEAVGVARKRCWRFDWVLDLDIKGFFNNIRHELLMRAVRKHTKCKWVILYIERWLKAPIQEVNGTVTKPIKGTPQGSVVSPLLANLFLHYTCDRWMQMNQPHILFERYADDVICHCNSESQAMWLLDRIKQRFSECGLELHPQKTKIVYCKDTDRKGNYPKKSFDFLGFTFQPRKAKSRWGKYFINFSPGISKKAASKIRQTIKKWKLHRRYTNRSIEDIAHAMNPIIQGWINYYGSYYKTALYPIVQYLDQRFLM